MYVYSELDLGGEQLANITLPVTPSLTLDDPVCIQASANGVPGSITDFCPFYPIGVNFTGQLEVGLREGWCEVGAWDGWEVGAPVGWLEVGLREGW